MQEKRNTHLKNACCSVGKIEKAGCTPTGTETGLDQFRNSSLAGVQTCHVLGRSSECFKDIVLVRTHSLHFRCVHTPSMKRSSKTLQMMEQASKAAGLNADVAPCDCHLPVAQRSCQQISCFQRYAMANLPAQRYSTTCIVPPGIQHCKPTYYHAIDC
jgi:hypothetical protein